MAAARSGKERTVAVVCPYDAHSFEAIFDAAQFNIRPLLVGEPTKIAAAAERNGRDLDDIEIVAARHDADAAVQAVRAVREQRADVLMKGFIHSDDFLRPVLDKTSGLRASGRMSHAFVCLLPSAVYHKPLIVTDAAFNITPDLETKLHIARNAVTVARALGASTPKIAVLAAVETVNPAMPCTLDAAALCKMAERGQLPGATIDGPLAFDNAISREAALAKGIDSPVAGDPDILLVPDIHAGNILYKTLAYMCGAVTPGIVVGATAPVLLTSRNDPAVARLAGCAIAAAMAGA